MSASPADKAKQAVLACEKEITGIKSQIRSLAGESDEDLNSLTIAWLKTEGLPESAEPKWKLQLSSPIEEATLDKIYDPLGETTEEGVNPTTVVFRGVEVGQATMTLSGMDNDIPLGESIAYDVGTLTKRPSDAPVSSEPIVTELAVLILPKSSSEAPAEEEKSSDHPVDEAVCTVTLRITYKPSQKDQREVLYEKLSYASQKKAAAVEELRQVALASSRQLTESSDKRPAVRSGFLNKKEPKPASKLQAWYDKNLGPNSLLRQMLPVAKNYIIFFGAVVFFHYQGQQFALPPPV